ncbi:NAD(P)-dependent oxidoreductase [Rhodococcus fascians]|nr:NAD(P)-dependent oxidoreductase [Rhodococcus fascians]MBY4140927.1 NAD(P)-dependent oxidoreductase [Rhodococcus fascians]MBY4219591.1 NAD(P)-dependent oxidoreductase [Rhodococcus fascians]MBY4221900.1 NAD(P)-dependent oxidoreductase [Rhodococcus fascians]MBY4233901.1 NAD(P)-dependent oxidoreductase [Rhodococcus fascians]
MAIGFVGAGRMGMPMVARLVDAGERVRVLVRSSKSGAEPAKRFETVRSVVDIAVGATTVIVCVHTDEQVLNVCIDGNLIASMHAGSTLIVHTTGSPYVVKELAAIGKAYGVTVVDAPVSGSPDDIAGGVITTFVGGSESDFDSAARVLRHYSNPMIHVGPLGSGQLTKLVNNVVFASNVAILESATRIGIELGLEETALVGCLQRGSARSAALDGVARAGSSSAFAAEVDEFLVKDIAVVRQVAADVGLELGSLGTILDGASLAR